MARNVYNDEQRALVKVTLEANGGNVKRTARETGIPIMTVRDWKKKWEREGVPATVSEALPAVIDEFVGRATSIRNKMLDKLDEEVPNMKGRDLIVGIGVLTDKVRLVEGKATSRTEHDSPGSLPVEQVRELFAGFAKGIVEAAQQRDSEISFATEEAEDAEWTEQPVLGLPAASE